MFLNLIDRRHHGPELFGAEGGYVSGATNAVIGEAGPET